MSSPILHQIVARARELVADEKSWCQKTHFLNGVGVPCRVGDPDAARFCAFGALYRATWELVPDTPNYAERELPKLVQRETRRRGRQSSPNLALAAAKAVVGPDLTELLRANDSLRGPQRGRQNVLNLFDTYLRGDGR